MSEVLERVWEASLSATVLMALGLAVLVCFRGMPVWCRYGIWLLVLARLLVPVAPPAGFSVWNLAEREAAPVVVSPSLAGYQPAIQQTASLRHEGEPVEVIPLIWLAGVLGWMGLALVRHQRLARWVRRQSLCSDARVLLLLEQARRAFGVRAVCVIVNERFEAPAVFGVWRPRVLLPAAWLKEASDEELFLVLLHELAHVKCRDGLLNWVCIFAHSLHWFNPAAWYAMRRLRREREIFCDALVLARLRPEQRPGYGSTLIKMAAQLSAVSPATLVPILQHKPEIHRRIHMIAKYKPTPRMLSAGAALVLVALAGLTFTRAADKKPNEPAAAPKTTPLQMLEEEVSRQRAMVSHLQAQTAELREGVETVEPGNAENLRKLESLRVESQANVRRLSALHKHLTEQTGSNLRRAISTASPDAHLSELMATLDRTEQKLAELSDDRAPEHPEVKRTARVIKQINHQIEDRIDGILKGLKARMAAEEAHLEALGRALEQAIRDYREGLQRSRPYHAAVQELRAQEEILQRLRVRVMEQRIERAVEGAKGK